MKLEPVDLEQLRAAVGRAIATIERLERDRRRLRDKLATLRERMHRLERARRRDRTRLRRLELLEQERRQVRERLEALLERLEQAAALESPEAPEPGTAGAPEDELDRRLAAATEPEQARADEAPRRLQEQLVDGA